MDRQYKDVLYDVRDHVATITINRPETFNAFTQNTIYEWEEAPPRAPDDRDVVVIISRSMWPSIFRP